jgi:hypothetical protein
MFTTVPGGGFCGDGDTTREGHSSDSQQDFDPFPDTAG